MNYGPFLRLNKHLVLPVVFKLEIIAHLDVAEVERESNLGVSALSHALIILSYESPPVFKFRNYLPAQP